MRIGLLGGSFNPVHLGHMNLVKYSLDNLNLDKIILIPCFQSVDKKLSDYAPSHHRVKMLEKLLIPKCFISLFEINKQEALQSFETVRYFKSIFPNEKLFFIIGEDNLVEIEKWENIWEINDLTQIVVFKRFKNSQNFIPKIKLNLLWMNNEIWDYSASDFRDKKKKILSKEIEKYIKDNKLYNLNSFD